MARARWRHPVKFEWCFPTSGHTRSLSTGPAAERSGVDSDTVDQDDIATEFAALSSPLAARAIPRIINMNRLGDALSLDPARIARAHYHPCPTDRIPDSEHAGPPVKTLIVYNCNPAAVAPDQSAVIEGLCRDDLFTVVMEHFQTDTANYADYILPATTQLEHWDVHRAYGHLYLALNRPAIAPVGESLPNSEIFRRLAAALGYDQPCFRESDEAILQAFVDAQTHVRFADIYVGAATAGRLLPAQPARSLSCLLQWAIFRHQAASANSIANEWRTTATIRCPPIRRRSGSQTELENGKLK